MAKKLNQNVYVHGDPDTGEGAGWYGPDYPDAKVTAKISAQIGEHAFSDDEVDDASDLVTPDSGMNQLDLERDRAIKASRKKVVDEDLVGAPADATASGSVKTTSGS
jgi:hypothetical protein